MRILFLDERMFDIDGVYNAQNDRVWAVDRATARKKQVSPEGHGLARGLLEGRDTFGDLQERNG